MSIVKERISAYEEHVTQIDEAIIAWFGGWLSADGSIKIADKKGRPAISFQVCDKDPLERIANLFGNDIYGPMRPSGLGKTPRYGWRVTGWKAVIILKRVYPWLSDRYAKRADMALRYQIPQHSGKVLKPIDVAYIKKQLSIGGHGTGRRLAKKYGVSDSAISAIKHGRVWSK